MIKRETNKRDELLNFDAKEKDASESAQFLTSSAIANVRSEGATKASPRCSSTLKSMLGRRAVLSSTASSPVSAPTRKQSAKFSLEIAISPFNMFHLNHSTTKLVMSLLGNVLAPLKMDSSVWSPKKRAFRADNSCCNVTTSKRCNSIRLNLRIRQQRNKIGNRFGCAGNNFAPE